MTRKSDRRSRRRITATAASRTFSTLLDKVEAGERFVVHRHGRDVCVIDPAPVEGRNLSEIVAILRSRTPVYLDDEFGRDLTAVIEGEVTGPNPWDS